MIPSLIRLGFKPDRAVAIVAAASATASDSASPYHGLIAQIAGFRLVPSLSRASFQPLC